jgi:pyruvate dehydrogenase E2 component (dihydrolipoamide acetyltransferase)
MATVVNMPRLSDTMTEGTVATWLKKVGDKIEEGDILAEIETDKATMEFESFNAGVLLHIGIQEGETAGVDSLLAIIGEDGEDISGHLNGKEKKSDSVTSDKKEEEENKENSVTSDKKEEEENKEEVALANEKSSSPIPKGVIVVTMPRLSDTMTTGTVATWLKQVGDTIKEGDILAEIETDKATMEFESFNAGTLLKIGVQEGETADVDTLLAIIGPAGTDVSGITASNSDAKEDTKSDEKDGIEESIKTDAIETSSNVTVENNNSESGRIFASPLAKQIAKEKGFTLSHIKGSGENGRIVKSDVENFIPNAASEKSEILNPIKSEEPISILGEESSEQLKNSQMRKTIARRLSESIFTAPHFYLTIEVVMDNAIASRTQINAMPDTKVSFNDLVIKASAMALKKHPKVNSQWTEEFITINHHVHIGVAVAVEDGLVVPVVKHADLLGLTYIGTKVKELAVKAKAKKLQPSEMDASTFTVSNLGMFGITEFTSIINQPNSAILSVGAIVEKPVVKNGQIVVGNTMILTLACDHRTVDGATGAQFLQTLKTFLENPVTMLA